MKFASLILPVVLAGALSAQTTAPAKAEEHHPQARNSQMMMQRLTKDLNLTADQQTKAKNIFDQSWAQRKAISPKLREERGAILNAIKSDNPREIDRLIQENSHLNAQAAEIHAKAMAKFYAMLNPDQKVKMDQRLNAFMHPMEHHAMHSTAGQTAGSR